MTVRELAERTGISRSTLNDLENNKRIPTPEYLARIAKALEVDEKDLWWR